MGGGSEKAGLQVLAKSVVDGEGDDEGSDPGGDSEDGDGGDDADESLPALGAEIAGCDEEFKAHRARLSALGCQLSVNADYSDLWGGWS